MMTRNNLAIGSTLYYLYDATPHTIVGETKQSWLIEYFGRTLRVSKRTLTARAIGGFSHPFSASQTEARRA